MSASARQLQAAGALIVVGLGIEGVSLTWPHPTAFLLFAGGAGLCVGGGVLVYLHSLLFRRAG